MPTQTIMFCSCEPQVSALSANEPQQWSKILLRDKLVDATSSHFHPSSWAQADIRRAVDVDRMSMERQDQARPGRQTSSRVRTQREQTSGQSKLAAQPPQDHSPVRRVRHLAVCDLSQKQRNQFASHRADEHHHSQHQPPSLPVAPLASGSWLGTTPRTIGAACRDGGGSAGSWHAVQVRHRPSGARQPARARRTNTRPPCWANVQRRPS
jgi:hypothetical protein